MIKIITLTCILLFTLSSVNGQVTVYDTTHASNNGVEITATANGPATKMGDAIVLAGTQRLLNLITADMVTITDVTPFTVTMTLYTDCSSVTGAGACGSGVGIIIPGSSVTVSVTPPAIAGTQFTVDFPYASLDLSSETYNTITVMINASRNNVLWRIGETPVIGAMPAGEAGTGVVTRCGSTQPDNGCFRNFNTNNNFAMKITASAPLATKDFLANKFLVTPNPANDFVNISNSENIKVSNIKITDLNGRVVKQKNFDNVSNINLNVSDLSSGVYMININTNEGSTVKKIIKN